MGVVSEALCDWPGKFFLSFLTNYVAKHEIIVNVLGIMTCSSFCFSRCAFESEIEVEEIENREQFLPICVLRVKNRFRMSSRHDLWKDFQYNWRPLAARRPHARSIICSCLNYLSQFVQNFEAIRLPSQWSREFLRNQFIPIRRVINFVITSRRWQILKNEWAINTSYWCLQLFMVIKTLTPHQT